MPLLLPLILSAETLTSTDHLQQTLLRLVFKDTKASFLHRIDLSLPLDDVHFTEGEPHLFSAPKDFELSYCTDSHTKGTLKRVWMMMWKDAGNINIHFLPQSIQHVAIVHCLQSFQFYTRCLPRESQIIDLSYNRIVGSVQLPDLPDKIETFAMVNNKLKGTISLVGLPNSLRALDLQQNDFSQKVVYYDKLPENIQKAYVKTWDIGRILPISEELERHHSLFGL